MLSPDDIAAIRGLLQEALRPYEDEVVALRFTVGELTPSVERHTDELRGVARALREVEPTVEKLSIIVGETVPELVRRMDNITDHLQRRGMLGEIDRESQRAAGEKA